MPSLWPALLLPLLLGPAAVPAAPAGWSPRITGMSVHGAQRGGEVTVELTGQRLDAPQELLLLQPGLAVLDLQSGKSDRCTVRLRIPADCALGAHGLRLRTDGGISNLVLFQVAALPEVTETRKGDAPQAIAIGTTVNGSLRAEETDRYTVALTAGTTLYCDVSAVRLGLSAADFALTVVGPDGAVVAAADDSLLGQKDPMLAFTARADGDHEVRVHAAFTDAQNVGPYRLQVSTAAQPFGAIPCGGSPGKELTLRLLGGAPDATATVRLPNDGSQIFRFHPEGPDGVATSPILLRVGGPPNRDPQPDDQGRRVLEIPGAVHDVLAAPDQTARWFFQGERGREIEFRVVARSLRSALDAALVVREAGGRFLAYNDDGAGSDSVLRFTPAADGQFQVEVRDLLRRGSPQHFFRLEATARGPSTATSLRMVVGRNVVPVLAVPRGGHGTAVLQLDGADPAAGLALLAEDLPDGVSAHFGPILRGSNLVAILLEASADAPLQGAAIDFALRAEQEPHQRRANYLQVLPLVVVRNNQPILQTAQRRLPVAVTAPAPFAVRLDAPDAPLVRGAPIGIRVRLQRANGFAEPVRIRAGWSPPGVSAGQITIAGKDSEGILPVEASTGAMLGTFPFTVVASVSRGGGVLDLAAPFTALRIDEPWLTAELGRVRVEPGGRAELKVQLAERQAPTGPVTARLLGLPRGIEVGELPVAPGAGAVTFPMTFAADAPPGRHRGFLLELLVPTDQGTARHRFGGGEIRIDRPAAVSSAPTGKDQQP